MASDGAAGDAAQALRRSEERYRSLFASIDDGFCICEILVDERGEPRDYRFVEVNPTFEAHTGLRDAAGRTALELVPGLERHWIDVYAEVARTGRPVRFEQGSDAMRRWFDVYAFRVGDPGERLVGILFKDVSERRRAEQDLRESESRFRELADGAPIFVWMADADARLTYVNRTAVDFLGLPPAALGGRGWEAVVHPDDVPRLHAAYAAAARERVPYAIEVRYRRAASGAYEWHLVQGVPRWVGGAFAGMMGTAANIHDRKLAEDALRAADRRKDEFLATLAHELRNPLAPLRNGLAVLRLADGLPAPLDAARAMMERQLAQMVRLIDDLLDVSRISLGKIALRRERVALAEVVAQAVETSRPALDAARHAVVVDAGAAPVVVDADATRLVQVFANLLNNAAKFTDPGGHVSVRVRREGGEAVVSVRDDGVGMDADELGRVFDLFAQADASPSRERGGLGIGLSLVRGIVELHGGRVEASSAGRGRGSEFVVRLPAVDAPAPTPPVSEPAAHRAGQRVLVVDDSRDAAESLAIMLRLMGHDARCAFDAAAALALGDAFAPRVVVLDLGMPRVSGLDAARAIRSRPWGRDATLVALTGWGQDEDRRRTAAAGFDAHLVKPVDVEALAALLARLPADPT